MPDLSEAEVSRYANLGEYARTAIRAGNIPEARNAYRAQIDIFAPNFAPYVSLAMLEAGLGSHEEAMDRLRQAVARGYRDFQALERAEAWIGMPRGRQYLELKDAAFATAEIEQGWPGWGLFKVARSPASAQVVLARHRELDEKVDAMAPALGPRLTELWHRLIRRASAAMLEAYVTRAPEGVTDLDAALQELMVLYAGDALSKWQALPPDVANRLASASELALKRLTESDPLRPSAMVGRALRANLRRDRKGHLTESAERTILRDLETVVERHPASPVYATALVGWLETQAGSGNFKSAAIRYRRFLLEHVGDEELLQRVREDLGHQALRLGGIPPFVATTLAGEPLRPEDLVGKVVVYDFWATWCGPCMKDLPFLRRVVARFGDDVALVGINMDDGEMLSREQLASWIEENDVPGIHIQDGLGWGSELVSKFGVTEIPFNVVVSPQGEVFAVDRHGKQLERAVRAALADDG